MSIRVVRDIVYREINGTSLKLDLHLPEGEQVVPGAVLYFHGGGFQVGERSEYEAERAQVLASFGIPVITVQYRFVDVALFPAPFDDGRAAIEWVREHAAEHGFVADKIGVWGASAGANIALWLGLGSERRGFAPDADAVAAWFPIADFRAINVASPLEEAILNTDDTDALFGEKFDPTNPVHLDANIMSQVSGTSAPALIITGDRDRVVEPAQSIRLHEALVQAGATSSLILVGGAGHEAPETHSATVLGAIAGFFRENLAPGATPAA